MDASQIQQALVQHHVIRASDETGPLTFLPENLLNVDQNVTFSNVSGECMATLFADAASRSLPFEEYCELLAFLQRNPFSLSSTQHEQPPREVDRRLQDFYAAETAISGQDMSRLCIPSGKDDAELVIILHCQTRELPFPTGNFWDTTTFTIQLLASKGFSTEFFYGYDWHWRAEEKCVGRGKCSAAKWPQVLKHLHDDFSYSLFTILPSRFALIGGSCAREHIRKHLDSSPTIERRTVSMQIDPTTGLEVVCDLVYQNKCLNRIIFYIYHPSATSFEDPKGPKTCSIQIDAASNFLLWLLGKPHDPVATQRLISKYSLCRVNAAPITDIQRYIALEKRIHRPLVKAEYHDEFLKWAKRFLAGRFDAIIKENTSIARACAEKMNRRAWVARIKSYLARERQNQRQSLDDSARRWSNSHTVYIEASVELNQEGNSRYFDLNRLLGITDTHHGSLDNLSESEFRYLQAQINRSITYNRKYHPRPKSQELWDSHMVTIYSNGVLPIWVPWKETALKCQICPQACDKIENSIGEPTIHFLPEKIVLKIGDEIVFSRSNIFLQHGQCGNDWKRQIEKEHRAKGYAMIDPEYQRLNRPSNLERQQRGSNSHTAGQNADRRQQLLQGTVVHCGERKNDNYGRATLRGPLCILVPQDADFSWVWVQCDLLERERNHPESCAKNAHDGDPSKRLGVRVRYKSRASGETEEVWFKWKTDRDTKKLNSLVDFLDGECEEYTTNQPRRYLPKKRGQNGRPATYT